MRLAKRYQPATVEPRLAQWWQERGVYDFERTGSGPLYSVDTPPPTVSGSLHLGHVYSYSHVDFVARYRRMLGDRVFYPMGFDDNGLPTERLVERQLGRKSSEVGRQAFIDHCLRLSEEMEATYRSIWLRLGLSVDWHYSYRTIGVSARKAAQTAFVKLFQRGVAYRQEAPTIWCPTCRTAIAQAEVDDLPRPATFYTILFTTDQGRELPIATTRPELLPACVAVLLHPSDPRARQLREQRAIVPLFGRHVPLLEDEGVDITKGTGIVMCCTFGDSSDVEWWRQFQLPLLQAIDESGQVTALAGSFAGLDVSHARQAIVRALDDGELLLSADGVEQSVGVHERCDTPVEYIATKQWFVNVLAHKQALLKLGDDVTWYPEHMRARYTDWVENLKWDWCISRQRTFGVPIPAWYCDRCGAVAVPQIERLPLDPQAQSPAGECQHCGHDRFTADGDVMDTWATSSHSPQIAGRWDSDADLHQLVSPYSVRPQGHEIIRTWAFYTMVKSFYLSGEAPWKALMISGLGISGPGMAKLSKSKNNSAVTPMEMMQAQSADAVRYWAASSGLGRDAVITEEKVRAGGKLVTKLWNVAKFCDRFLESYQPGESPGPLSPGDRWILSCLQRVIGAVTERFETYDYAGAKMDIEQFFWLVADNYIEMAKQRLYEETESGEGARYALFHLCLNLVKLFAPILPYVTEEIYRSLFALEPERDSVHLAAWPTVRPDLLDPVAETTGDMLRRCAGIVRRYKSERNLSLGASLTQLDVFIADETIRDMLEKDNSDLASVTRAGRINFHANAVANPILADETLAIAVTV